MSLAATTSRIAVGLFADRAGQEPLRPVATMLAASVAGYLLLIAGEPAVIAAAALVAGSLGWAWPGGLTLAVVQRSPEAPGWAVGVMMTGLFVGAVTGPLLTGLLAEHELFEAAWIVCAALALLAAATIVATLRRGAVAFFGSMTAHRGQLSASAVFGLRRRRAGNEQGKPGLPPSAGPAGRWCTRHA